MSTREKLLELLKDCDGEYVSGNMIAEKLGITRAAVWKSIKQLEKDGYSIDAVTNKGYRLAADNDVVDDKTVIDHLDGFDEGITIEVKKQVTSTNTLLKEEADMLENWHVLIAGEQTAGRGRTGRSFFSPAGTGVYISVIMKEGVDVDDSGKLTTKAAIAACRAIEECVRKDPKIKWVNDVFVDDKKVCGILTEASVNFETGLPEWVITGIGFNVYEPDGGFPEEIRDIAGGISQVREKDLRAAIAASFVRNFYELCHQRNESGLHKEYKDRCFILGKKIYVIKPEGEKEAKALDILEDFSLLVKYKNGKEEVLKAGEVSTRPGDLR